MSLLSSLSVYTVAFKSYQKWSEHPCSTQILQYILLSYRRCILVIGDLSLSPSLSLSPPLSHYDGNDPYKSRFLSIQYLSHGRSLSSPPSLLPLFLTKFALKLPCLLLRCGPQNYPANSKMPPSFVTHSILVMACLSPLSPSFPANLL